MSRMHELKVMQALPYLDSLIKEYLLFRGFTRTLQAFAVDAAADLGCGFQADPLTRPLFSPYILNFCSL